MTLLLSQLNNKSISITKFADDANHMIVSILQKAGEEILSFMAGTGNPPGFGSFNSGLQNIEQHLPTTCQQSARLRASPARDVLTVHVLRLIVSPCTFACLSVTPVTGVCGRER